MPADNNKTFGARGEADTAAFLQTRGYQLIDANVRPLGGMARGELDLIAWHDGTLVFIEVKTRRAARGRQGAPAEAVDARKQKQLIALASAYLAHYALDDVPCRFDVVEVIERDGRPPQFTLIPNAFDATE
ncbi:MAG: YraN family protein [Armatimonadota bacterium]|nr:YraN family protein [Armatimonadota bacterium]